MSIRRQEKAITEKLKVEQAPVSSLAGTHNFLLSLSSDCLASSNTSSSVELGEKVTV